ncbi:MAG: DegT/DnrJ/EryC1/StrS family aminotransferase [Burkholderiales bacterium]
MLERPTIPLFKVFMSPRDQLMPRLEEILYGGQISEGPPVAQFERQFAKFVGQSEALSFYSGTAALHAALVLAGVKPGDEVISTPMTAEPTNLAILHAGGKPIWSDVDPSNGNIEPQSVEAMITPRTRAIMAVHYGGIPVNLRELHKVAAKWRIPVIEDAAHALGARFAGEQIGAHSPFVMYSLQAIKHLTTVDGGMLICRDGNDLARGRRFRWFGMDRLAPRGEVDIKELGYKYHMNNVNAVIGQVQLNNIGPAIERHIENGRWFDQSLAAIDGLRCCAWDSQAEPSYWFYTVLAERRDDLIRALASRGIESSMAHRRNDLHSVFAASRRDLPGLDSFYSKMLHIPCGWWVTDEQREYIAQSLRQGW